MSLTSWNKIEQLAAEMRVAEVYAELYPDAVKDRARAIVKAATRSEHLDRIEAVEKGVENS